MLTNKSPKLNIPKQEKPTDNLNVKPIESKSDKTQNSCRVDKMSKKENLDGLFCELNKLNEETTSKVHHMLALTKLAQNRYSEAISHLKLATEMGYSKAAFNLGLCFQNGLGVNPMRRW
jgi:TPR repeat protein